MAFTDPARAREYKREWKRLWKLKNPEAYAERARIDANNYYHRNKARLIPKMVAARSAKRAAKLLTEEEAEMLRLFRHYKMLDTRRERARRAPERIKLEKQRYYQSHKQHVHEKTKRWQAANPERSASFSKKWREANPEKHRQRVHRRRALLVGATTEDCTEAIRQLRLAFRCHWCGTKLNRANRTIDHVMPLSRGGAHCADNLVAACGHCNKSKGSKLVGEWERKEATSAR